jgi:AraC-like DNA-binding protein
VRKIRAAVLIGIPELIDELGGDSQGIIERAGLNASVLDNADTLVPARSCFQILDMAAREPGCAYIGLELAKRRDIDTHLGILSDVSRTAPTLGDALRDLVKLFNIHSEISLWQLQQDNEVAYLTCSLINNSGHSDTQVQQFSIAVCWRLIRALLGTQWRPAMVTFTHARPANTLPFSQMFDVPVEFDSDSGGLLFHATDLNIELPSRDADSHRDVIQKAHMIQQSRQLSIAEEVETLIRKNLEMNVVGQGHVMKFLPFDRRTLQRKLAKCGTNYRQLLEKIRMDMAQELLASSSLPLTMVALRLGYANQSIFSNAFKQNTGQSPREWRKEKALGSIGTVPA